MLCEIDVQATLKAKLGVDRDPYLILGACNPSLAHAALEAEPELGVLLPCNIVVYEQDGQTHIAAVDAERMLSIVENDELAQTASEVRRRWGPSCNARHGRRPPPRSAGRANRCSSAANPSISAAEASERVARRELVLIDVRQPVEVRRGRVDGSVNIPLGQLRDRLPELDRDQKLAFMCHSGTRSARATTIALKAGYDAVNLRGGMIAYNRAGPPVTR